VQADGDAEAAACEVGETDGDLAFYNWSDYMDPALIDAFEEEYGITVTEDFYPSNEELFARVESGGAQYDVIVPSDYMVDIMIQEELLLALDQDALTNLGNIDDDFTDPPYDPGLEFSVPYQWGTTGLGVDLDVTGDVEPSWDLLFDAEVAGPRRARVDPRRPARGDGRGAVLARPRPEHHRRGRAAGGRRRDRGRP
jgi:spermidine/putrescine transport system substrate-binding protein